MDYRNVLLGNSHHPTDQLRDEVKSILEYVGLEDMSKNLNHAALAVCGRFLLGDRQLAVATERRKALQTLCTLLRTMNSAMQEGPGKYRADANLTKCTMTLALSELRDLSSGLDSSVVLLCDVLRQSLSLMEDGEREEWISSVKTECENALSAEVFGEVTSEQHNLRPDACLRILEVVLECVDAMNPCKGVDIDQELKSPTDDLSPFINTSNLKLHQIFVQMVLGQNEGLRAHLLVVLIPLLVKVERSVQLLRELWDALCGLDCDVSGFRSLGTVCALADFFLPIDISSCRWKRFPLVDRPKFWRLLQNGLSAEQPLARKQALYLLKRAIDVLVRNGKAINFTEFEWDPARSSSLQTSWQDLFLVLEALEEAQAHLVRPVLNILSRQLNISNSNKTCISLPWILCAFQRVLQHPSQVINSWGVETLLGPIGSGVVASAEAQTYCRFILKSLLPSLNSQSLYNAEGGVSKLLTEFFCSTSKQTCAKTFFPNLLHSMTCLPWGPVPLYFITEALSQVPAVSHLNTRDLKEMIKLVTVTLKTQSVTIRAATQSRLLMVVTHLSDAQQIDFNVICDLLSAFNRDECLRRGTEAWLGVVRWLCKFVESQEAITWLTNTIKKPGKSEVALARVIVLLLDSGNLDNLEMIEQVLETIRDSETRLYACQDSQNSSMKLLAHLIQESESLPISSEEDSTREMVVSFVQKALKDCVALSGVRLQCAREMSEFHRATNFLPSLEIMLLDPVILPLLVPLNLEGLLHSALDVLKNYDDNPPLQVFFAVSICKYMAVVQEHSCLEHFRPIITEAVMVIFSSGKLCQPLITQRDSKLPQELLELQGQLVSMHTQSIWELLAVSPEISKDWDDQAILAALDAAEGTLEFGGRSALAPLLLAQKHILSQLPLEFCNRGLEFLDRSWRAVLDLRRNELFWPALSAFISALMQPTLVLDPCWASGFALQVGRDLFQLGDSVRGVANILVISLQNMARQNLQGLLQSPLRELLVNALLFGPVHRKDQRATNDTCKFIKSLGEHCAANVLIPCGDRSDTAVRASAIEIISHVASSKEPWTETVADQIVIDLLEMDRAPEMRRSRYFGDSHTHRCKNRILQSLLILEPATSCSTKILLLEWARERLILENHQPSVRYQTEWLMVRLLFALPQKLKEFWCCFSKEADLRAGAVCSLVGVILHTALMMENSSCQPLFDIECHIENSLVVLVPFTMAQHFNVRLHAQVAILQLWTCVEHLNLKSIKSRYDLVVKGVSSSIQHASGAGHTRVQQDFYFHAFHPSKYYTLETIFEELPRLANVTSDEWISVDELLSVGLRTYVTSIPLRNPDYKLREFKPSPWVQRPSTSTSDMIEENIEGSVLQKKMVPWKWMDPTEELLQSLPEFSHQTKLIAKFPESNQKPSLIVVASLLDKAPNQGGLARTCEILGAALVLPSLSCAQDREFRALSMSAEMWIPMCEVKPFQLPQFLTDMKSIGYTLVGAEQTAGSTPLNNSTFPPQTVLLLGNEREGIPANLLPLLDQCVEVPQCGLVRSLNVHVTGALFMWEYACQHFFQRDANTSCVQVPN